MLNKERMRLWIAALRSGRYIQGRSVMNFQSMYCCLGVACDVAIKNGLDIPVKSSGGFLFYDSQTNYLPESVSAWYGFSMPDYGDPRVGDEIGLRAIRANDELRWTFNQIADSLERMYLADAE